MTCVGIIMTPMISVKNGWRNFHSYATSAYAVSVEKYTAHTVAPVEIMSELKNPVMGLKVLPANTAKLLLKNVDGISEIACC